MRKKIRISFLLTTVILLIGLGVFLKKYLDKKSSNPYHYTQYIKDYPKQRKSIIAPIKIELAAPFNKADYEINTPINVEILKFNPTVKGTLFWSDNKTLEFYPDYPLKSDFEYRVKVDINKIFALNKRQKPFQFHLKTIKQNLNLHFDELLFTDTSGKLQQLMGNVAFTDFIAIDKIDKLFEIKQGNKKLEWSFIPSKNKQAFSFKIMGIESKEKVDTLKIAWNFEQSGKQMKGCEQYFIMPKSSFQVKEIFLLTDSTNRLIINFSNLVNEQQNLSDLLRIKGLKINSTEIKKNKITVYLFDDLPPYFFVEINKNIKNIYGKTLPQNYLKKIVAVQKKPTLLLSESTFLMPNANENLNWQFKAKMLKSIQIRIYQVFSNNILQFFQINDYKGINEIDRVGKKVYEKTIHLDNFLNYNPYRLNEYVLNISDFDMQKGCIYSIIATFDKENVFLENEKIMGEEQNKSSFFSNYYGNKKDTNNIYSSDFYGFRKSIHQNIYYTNWGIITKKMANDLLYIWVSNLKKTAPEKDVKVQVLNYQQQIIAEGKTNGEGLALFKLNEIPIFVKVIKNKEHTFFKLPKKSTSINILNDSRHDVKGVFIKNKPYWYKGDTMHICFLHNNLKTNNLNQQMSIFSPDGKKIYSEVSDSKQMANKIYAFYLPTYLETGNYKVNINIENQVFSEYYKIVPRPSEQMQIHLEKTEITSNFYVYKFKVNSIAKYEEHDCNAQIKRKKERPKSPKNYEKYMFGTDSEAEDTLTIQCKLDAKGNFILKIPKQKNDDLLDISHSIQITINHKTVGFKEEHFLHKIACKNFGSGIAVKKNYNLKKQHFSLTVEGIKTKKERKKSKWTRKVRLKLYRINNDSLEEVAEHILQVKKQTFLYHWDFPFLRDGDYSLKVFDQKNKLMNALNFNFLRKIRKNNFENILSDSQNQMFKIVNKSVKKGDTVFVDLLMKEKGKLLFVVENDEGIYYKKWINTEIEGKRISFLAKNNTNNLLTITGYLLTSNAKVKFETQYLALTPEKKKIEPLIFGQKEIKTEKNLNLIVKEKNGQALDYVLLPFASEKQFFESIKKIQETLHHQKAYITCFSDLSGICYYKKVNNELSEENLHLPKLKKNSLPFNFSPTIFSLKKEQTKHHKIKINSYIGDGIIGIFAINEKDFSYAFHHFLAHQPLLMNVEIPNQIAPNEAFVMPINIYSAKKNKENVRIKITSNRELSVMANMEKNISVHHQQNTKTTFGLKAKNRIGQGKINLQAKSNDFLLTKTFSIPIVTKGFFYNQLIEKHLEANEQWKTQFIPPGIKGTNRASIEYSIFKNLQLSKIIHQLLENEYEDIEQKVGAAFSLLFLENLLQMDNKKQYDEKIQKVINQLIYYQLPSGAFSFWKDLYLKKSWITTYVGYFMIEAQKKGYTINKAVYNKWLRYERKKYLIQYPDTYESDLEQAFSLYILSLADKAKGLDLDKINHKNIDKHTALLLSLTYAEVGKIRKAKKLQHLRTAQNIEKHEIFGNTERNQAICLKAYLATNNQKLADSLFNVLSEKFQTAKPLSLQGIAFSFVAFSEYLKTYNKSTKIAYKLNKNKIVENKSNKPYGLVSLPIEFTLAKVVEIKNKSEIPLNISIYNSGNNMDNSYINLPNNQFVKAKFEWKDKNKQRIFYQDIRQNSLLISCINITPQIVGAKYKNMFMEFTFPNSFRLLDIREQLKNKNIEYLYRKGNTLYYYFTLPPQGISIEIPFLVNFRGKFFQPPVRIYNLHEPAINYTIKGQFFEIRK